MISKARGRIVIGLNNTVFGLSGTVFNFIISIIIVRVFSQSLWGTFTQSMLTVILINILTGWGNKEYLLKEFSVASLKASLWQTSFISRLALFIPAIPLVIISAGSDLTQSWLLLFWTFTNFITRSFDSVIVFERKFKQAIGIESIGFVALIGLLFVMKDRLDLSSLTLAFALSSLLKCVVYFFYFRRSIFPSWTGKFDSRYLIMSTPYFLPPFIGFLQSRSDTFAVALRLSDKELGEYYILISLLSYCHATAVLAITPFLKNIYRINSVGFQKIRRSFITLGLAWSVVCITGIILTFNFVYTIKLPIQTYLVAWLTLPPYFLYFLLMQDFIRKGRPYPIVAVNAIAACANFLASILLINRFGFIGGIISCALMQWLLLGGFILASQIQTRKPVAI